MQIVVVVHDSFVETFLHLSFLPIVAIEPLKQEPLNIEARGVPVLQRAIDASR